MEQSHEAKIHPHPSFLLHYSLQVTVCHGGKPGQELKAGTRRQEPQTTGHEEHCLLTCSRRLAQSAFSYSPGPPGQAWRCPLKARPFL